MILTSLLMCWLLQRMEAALLLSPRGTILEYVHGTVSLTCYEANHKITTFQWNLTPSLNSSAYHIDSDQYSATLEIPDALRIFNGTVIQCQGNHSNGDVENSNEAELILQDTPLAVENFKISVGDYSILLMWSAPFSLFSNDEVQYLVSIENLTGLITTDGITSTTNYVLTSSHRIACDEFKITITPENWAGIGMNRSINLIYEEILVTNRNLTLNSKSHFDLLLSVTSPICEIIDMHIINVNLNETFGFDKEFANFSLIQDFDEGYQYYLKLDLQRRYQYQISMSLKNGNTSKYLSFNISTHLVRDVHIEPVSSDVLEIEIFYNSYSNTSNQTGAFLSMLYCNSVLCGEDNDFNPKNSLYLSIFETGANIYNITYASGNYLVYLYDTDSDGSLLPSYKSTCVSLFIRRLNLTLYGAQYYITRKRPCEIVYENDTVGSSCSLNENRENMEAKKQIVLQQLTYRNSSLLDTYGPTPLSERDCMRVEKQIFYGIIIAVSNYQKDRNIEPIGRHSLSDASLQSLCYPDITEATNTLSEENVALIASLSAGLLLVIVVGVAISVGSCVVLKNKQKRNSYTISKVNKED